MGFEHIKFSIALAVNPLGPLIHPLESTIYSACYKFARGCKSICDTGQLIFFGCLPELYYVAKLVVFKFFFKVFKITYHLYGRSPLNP